MRLAAIIAEYNPFHNGHAWHIAKTQEAAGATHILILMSGNFVQRGDFAITDKWTRALMALHNGADLVCELPYAFCAQSAPYFAGGAIAILNALNVCDILSFGSESGNLSALSNVASLLTKETETFQSELRHALSRGLSFPAARSAAIMASAGEDAASLLREPNNILGIEYLKALQLTNSTIRPFTISRKGDGYHDAHTDAHCFPSASWLRQYLYNTQNNLSAIENWIPFEVDTFIENFKQRQTNPYPSFFKTLASQIMTSELSDFRHFSYFEDGLEFALKNALNNVNDYHQLKKALVSKRLPESRIQRFLINLVMHYDNTLFASLTQPCAAPYLRVLGFNDRGREILRAIRDSSDLPILTNLRANRTRLNTFGRKHLDVDMRATDLWNLYCKKEFIYHQDMIQSPIII